MKVFKILICAVFVLVISACHDKNKTIYDYPDDDPTNEQGNIGDPCTKNEDCKSGLVCLNKVCSEPVSDHDQTDDTDTEPDGDEPTDDADTTPADDTDSDTGDHDINPTDDTDTNPDEDEPEDTDTKPDEDVGPYVPECGNGIKDEGEECDNGLGNSNESGITGITCRTDCTLAKCGDGIEDSGELCDDGNRADGDYCRYDCQGITGYCGDGILQTNEVCDSRNNPYCKEDCSEKTGECGDGILQSFEVCDNAHPSIGNHEGIGSYCKSNCKEKSGLRCGDKILQADMEECDDGDLLNGTYNHCNSKCNDSSPHCGDGILQRSNCNGYGANCVVFAGANEVCDDGNNEDGDYCSSDCQTSFGSCGDGIIQRENCEGYEENCIVTEGINEVCDKAIDGPYCSDDCKESFGKCGDGIVQEGIEECDYGENGENGPVPNGNLDCTYGSFAPCERCTLSCKKINGNLAFCGDGKRQSGEACDNGETGANPNGNTECAYGKTSCKVCSTDCQNESDGNTYFCGDGKIDTDYGEKCDPQKADDPNSPYCSDNCKQIVGRCGDGLPNGNEECDNGETGPNPNGNTRCAYGEKECEVCTTDCKIAAGTETSYCGNGGIDESNGEKCDDRQNNGKYLFNNPGYCNKNCKGWGEGGFCGDGTLQRANCEGFNNCNTAEGANEACDNGTDNGKTDCAYGETSCTVCTSSCTQTDGTETSYCGDGKVDSENGEKCDDGNTEDGDYCSADCKTNTGYCGDGTKQDNEVCDKADPSVGNLEGIGVYCSDDCQTKFGECGDGIRNKDSNGNWLEVCDDGVNNGKYSPDANNLYCNENCQGKGEGGYCGDATWQENEEECEHGGNIQIYCTYGQNECQVCTSDCTLTAGKTAKCNDGILQREDCTGYEDKGCVVTPNAQETCDDGVNNGRYGGFCNSECKGITPYCGDGILHREDCTGMTICDENTTENCCVEVIGADEKCDDGEHNGQYLHDAPGYCDSGCKGRGAGGYCGDHKKNGTEVCDEGDGINGIYGHCNSDCSGDSPKCGDGILHREDCEGYGENCVEFTGANEECDDGLYNSQYNHCNSNCSAQLTCGDGIIQREDCTGMTICDENTTENCCVEVAGATEKCDDGEENGGYEKCNSTCTDYNEGGYCGDGILQKANCEGYDICDENITENCCVVTPGADEKCDSGANNGKYSLEAPGYCNSNCDGFAEGGTCNDGIIQREDCTGFDICNENITENCCVVTEGANESCDEGDDNGQYKHCNSTCSGSSSCGDGIRDKDSEGNWLEKCDDGFLNGKYGNHCNTDCDGYTGYCDDGIIQRPNCEGYGENCVVTLDGTEECDDNVFNNGTYGHCDDECKGMRPERCGDGIIHRENCEDLTNCIEVPGAYENCDDGDDNNGNFGKCDKKCEVVINYRCGDGKVQKEKIEECGAMDICDENIITNCCEVVVFAQGDQSEFCDEGDGNNGTQEHCNSTCSGMTPYCGDGIIQRSNCTGYGENCRVVEGMTEECDDGYYNNYYGHCNENCTEIRPEKCGDGIIQRFNCTGFTNCEVVQGAYENCDEGNDNGSYYGHCNENCSNTTSNGSCGDGKIQKEDCGDMVICNENITSNCCEVVEFKPGDTQETCDEGKQGNGYHGHCNENCNGTSYCGDGILGKDEICEPELPFPPAEFGIPAIPCNLLSQFGNNALIPSCKADCMLNLEVCENKSLYISPFFETYQTVCYDEDGTVLDPCPGSSENFYGQEPGFDNNEFRYTAHNFDVVGDIVTENVSGLMWQKETPENYDYTLSDAEEYCNSLTIGGYSDWRLPTAAEFSTIINYAETTDGVYIHSSFTENRTDYLTKEGVVFSLNDVTTSTPVNPVGNVKCVRGSCLAEQCIKRNMIFDYENALATISIPGGNLANIKSVFWYFEIDKPEVSWKEALEFCESVETFDKIDKMRLPTVNELISLVDRNPLNPADGYFIFSKLKNTVWTSTTVNAQHDKAYTINFADGNIQISDKASAETHFVVCIE